MDQKRKNINKDNFHCILPQFLHELKKCKFFAIDTEFTGLPNNVLNDDGAARYEKLKVLCNDILVCQIGICLFAEREDGKGYTASPFSFHVFPRTIGNIDRNFMIQASSAQFLSYHNFDFNEWFDRGISYLNRREAEKLSAYLIHFSDLQGTDRYSFFGDIDMERVYGEEISRWLIEKQCGERHCGGGDVTSEPLLLDISKFMQHHYLLQISLRSRFSNIWTEEIRDSTGNVTTIKVTKVTAVERSFKEAQVKEEMQRCMTELRGFSQVIEALISSQKPLVAHNCLIDLVLIYSKFYDDLPERYEDMKSSIHKAFPEIYDTKHVVYKLRNSGDCALPDVLEHNSLEDLYVNIMKGMKQVLSSPGIQLKEDGNEMREMAHDAGYDAYMCGCVFLQLGHLMAVMKNDSLFSGIKYKFNHYQGVMKGLVNRVNVIKANIDHVNLCGADPHPKPIQMFVVSHTRGECLDVVPLLQLYSNADTQYLNESHSEALLTVCSRFNCYQELQAVIQDKHLPLTVKPYHHRSSFLQPLLYLAPLALGLISIMFIKFRH